ncbi:hypothetical protein B0H16DRAFT_1542461 [Mycena metata]|uniref:NADH dehydrogenase [ubiquinone] 1 alpha subcomplex subunit n=1 Tax=Mycena metata TaxID=1033252 RepID=A0AAD7NCW3_9AGAR|nr:hypothetical protein B0H16DRAFT_1542461 [Mycena metata]
MFFLRRIVQRLRGPNYFVGRDLEGNRYYEHPSLLDDPRPRRSVKYNGNSDDMHRYIGGNKRLAVQWSSWLTHTRPDAPSLEELQADLIRQERVRRNVALLEARDREEDRLRLAASSTPSATLSPPARQAENPPASQTADPADVPPAKPTPKSLGNWAAPDSDEPKAWTPHAATRGQ